MHSILPITITPGSELFCITVFASWYRPSCSRCDRSPLPNRENTSEKSSRLIFTMLVVIIEMRTSPQYFWKGTEPLKYSLIDQWPAARVGFEFTQIRVRMSRRFAVDHGLVYNYESYELNAEHSCALPTHESFRISILSAQGGSFFQLKALKVYWHFPRLRRASLSERADKETRPVGLTSCKQSGWAFF